MPEAPGPRPSSRAADRLAADVSGEVADLRVSLRRALDEAERLETAGLHERAIAVLEDQRSALAGLHERLSSRLADAAVERAAEHVVDAAPAGPRAASSPVEPTALRLVVTTAAAVAGVVLLLTPDLGGHVLRVAGWTTTASAPASPSAAGPRALDVPPHRDTSLALPATDDTDTLPSADRAMTAASSAAPGQSDGAAVPSGRVDLAEVADLIGRLAEAEDPPATVLGTGEQPASDTAPVSDEPEDEPTPVQPAPLEAPGTPGDEPAGAGDGTDSVPGGGDQTGLAPEGQPAEGVATAEPTVERTDRAR